MESELLAPGKISGAVEVAKRGQPNAELTKARVSPITSAARAQGISIQLAGAKAFIRPQNSFIAR
jgi:hypothetical protein